VEAGDDGFSLKTCKALVRFYGATPAQHRTAEKSRITRVFFDHYNVSAPMT
jgi:hypothetical protein